MQEGATAVKESLNDKLIVALVTFILTSLLGALWTFLLSSRSWERQTRLTLYKERYQEGTKFLDQLSELIGKRFFLLKRLLWAIEAGEVKGIQNANKQYFEVVQEWNRQFWLNRNKVRLLVDEVQAQQFLNYDDETRLEKPMSVHYAFVRTHKLVMVAKNDKAQLVPAQKALDSLNWKCSTFLEQLTTNFLLKATSLNLLTVPIQNSSIPDRIDQNDEKQE